MPNYMDDDVAAYMDDDVAVDVEMMMSTAHTQFRIGPNWANYFTDSLFYSTHSEKYITKHITKNCQI
jgi:hypothetical protein